jgi:hypothetical protein
MICLDWSAIFPVHKDGGKTEKLKEEKKKEKNKKFSPCSC